MVTINYVKRSDIEDALPLTAPSHAVISLVFEIDWIRYLLPASPQRAGQPSESY